MLKFFGEILPKNHVADGLNTRYGVEILFAQCF